jgi:hypothetical protein
VNEISGRELGRKIGTALGLTDDDLGDVKEITLKMSADAPAELTLRVFLRASDEAALDPIAEELQAFRLVPRDPDSSDNT